MFGMFLLNERAEWLQAEAEEAAAAERDKEITMEVQPKPANQRTFITKRPARLDAHKTARRNILLIEPYWEKQPQETRKQFEAFQLYRDMDKPNASAVARLLRKSDTLIRRWSAVNKWLTRVEAYLVYQDRQKLQIVNKERKERFEMQVELAKGMLLVGGARLQQLLDQVKAREKDPSIQLELSDHDAARYVDLGIKWSRVLDGLATEHLTIETPKMAAERLLKDAVSDVLELQKLDPSISLDKRIQWASADYHIEAGLLEAAVKGYLSSQEIDETDGAEN